MTETFESVAGFDRPQEPQDAWTRSLYEKFELGASPSLKDIEPKALELLGDIKTALSGAELVLGRRVTGSIRKEPDVLTIITTPGLSGDERFGFLLIQKEIEKMRATPTPG